MEFNVKDIRTKILHPSEQVTNAMDQEKSDDSIVGESVATAVGNADDDGKMEIVRTPILTLILVFHL